GGEATAGTFDENERYDTATGGWAPAPGLPTARHGHAAVALGQRIYVLAGGPTPGGSQSSQNEVYIVLPREGP
ncbi:MAG: galactose oxidase, partial [Chloroflexi bacterium]|nr:galactose oxidase [Chloroflexota bacterium]